MSLWKVFFSFLYPEEELDFVLDIYIGSMSLGLGPAPLALQGPLLLQKGMLLD